MSKYKLKTKKNKKSVSAFLNAVEDPKRRKDSKELLKIFKEVTGEKAVMWGTSIVGFGTYDYTYSSGQSGTWMITGFSPRKANLTVYILPGYTVFPKTLMKKLGPHKIGKSCLYMKRLDDIHIPTLKKLIRDGYKEMKKKYS